MKKGQISYRKIIGMAAIALSCFLYISTAFAADKSYKPSVTDYEFGEKEGFDFENASPVQKMSFGSDSVGLLTVSGAISKNTNYNGVEAYGIDDNITFTYSYDGSYNTKDNEKWNIHNWFLEVGNTIAGYNSIQPIGNGVFIIQKSQDGITWENAMTPVYDAFGKSNIDKPLSYVTNENDTKNGSYYRIICAYRITKANGETIIGFPQNDYKNCVELYQFYVCNETNYIKIKDAQTKNEIRSPGTVTHGFCIDRNGSEASIEVTKDSFTYTDIQSYDSFYESGEYIISITSKLGNEYQSRIKVSKGLKTLSMTPNVYESKKNSGFPMDNKVTGFLPFGELSYTTLKIAQSANGLIETSKVSDVPAYGITGEDAYVLLKINRELSIPENGFEVSEDKWGKGKKELIEGADVGQIGKGALIVQKSVDGTNWEVEDVGRYSKGLNTSDYGSYYKPNEDVFIYTPAGKDIIDGIYIRVLYAYQIYSGKDKSYKDYLEEYKFYLCSNELDAVTFHNLSVSKEIEEKFGDTDENSVKVYETAETLQSGSMTVSGFQIDKSQNPTVKYVVKKDGILFTVPSSGVIKQTGKYDITLKSAVGKEKVITIYVDAENSAESLNRYFGESFVDGKRIFSEGSIPVYEGGESKYQIAELSEEFVPVSGTITNKTTGKIINVSASRSKQFGELVTPGDYVATFTTETGTNVGDKKTFTFNFTLIANGTAPGPVINQRELNEYCRTNVSDSYPMYYGVTFQSASKGFITKAFADKESARNFAYNYEKGMVEKQPDGTYRYNGSLTVTQKEQYESDWDLTDAVNYFADQAVSVGFFDMSDDFTYRTLDDSIIDRTKNLRTLELNQSVTVFGEGEKDKLTSKNELPVIGKKKYAYLSPGNNGNVKEDYNDFKFIRDKYGCDSDKVVITDCNGKKYNIEYQKGVWEQLQAQECSTGRITITESTIYGDESSYEAIFIADGDITTNVELSYYSGGKENFITVDALKNNIPENVDLFSISSITDKLDPYAIVTVSKANDSNKYTYVADQSVNEVWSTPGRYHIKVVNRLGNNYAFDINVNDSDYTTIIFDGPGTEHTKDIITHFNQSNVKLPVLERYGYTFAGYVDQNGTTYHDQIAIVMSKSPMHLTVKWEPKNAQLIIKDEIGNIIKTKSVLFGSKVKLKEELPSTEYNVIGWEKDNEPINTENVIVDKENEIVLVAKVEKVDTNSSDIQTIENNTDAEEKKSSPIVPIIIVVIIILCISVLLVKKGIIKTDEIKTTAKKLKDTADNIVRKSKGIDNEDEENDD